MSFKNVVLPVLAMLIGLSGCASAPWDKPASEPTSKAEVSRVDRQYLSKADVEKIVQQSLSKAEVSKVNRQYLSEADVEKIVQQSLSKAEVSKVDRQYLSKADVEKIVHDYIMNNAQIVMDSINQYQMKSEQGRQEAGLAKNKDALFNDSTSPEAGNPSGDVTVVEFFDYNCHYCKGAFSAVKALLDTDKKVRFVFKDFPILGPASETAAKWALAAQKQKKYFEFHSAMMNNKSPIDDDLLTKVAKDVGLNIDQAKNDLASSEVLLQIEKNKALANDMGLRGTPAFVVGKDVIPGAIPLEELQKKIADQRQAAATKK